ncbi:MAG TPA: GYF domain-containing protein, partial [Vicinamibacterales bacterium]|nr:GYF domain-containing protein [Vicinamibacterales bacterium]
MDGSNQWYMAIGGHQVGPVSQQEIITNLQNGSIDAETLVFSAGMTQWQKVKDVAAFAMYVKGAAAPLPGAPGGTFVPPPAPGRRAHDIDFQVHGNEMQFVEVELDPGEGAVAEAGSMMYMTQGIAMETIFGDGSRQRPAGVMDALLGAGKRLL